ncbi:hypothetical protein [Haloterrigena sp. H1]|uniref:hypothetical protein n=1 Tax=Haloterrigena sp. H1 TaxID=2552943 RepID=UPI001486C475|nr:hypothetical protein [Haloterrigena sp. H1]
MSQQKVIEEFRLGLLQWAEDNLRSFAWRETSDPYEILVAEILLQKTAAEKVEPIYNEVIETYPTITALAEADQNELAEIIYSLGFQNQRSQALITIGQTLRDTGIPADEAQLRDLPYVGQYAANATLCFAYGEPRPIVDENVVRVYNRIFGTELGYRDEEAWTLASLVLPQDDSRRFNLAILDFGATICAPKVPNCNSCFFTHSCNYYQSISQE